MKNSILIYIIAYALVIACSFVCFKSFSDGTYWGVSRSIYTSEEYYGCAKIIVEENIIKQIIFHIIDSTNHEVFSEQYEKHFAGNQVYIQQCWENWKSIEIYRKQLIEKQEPDKIDAISGATWAYNLFKASVSEALENAK